MPSTSPCLHSKICLVPGACEAGSPLLRVGDLRSVFMTCHEGSPTIFRIDFVKLLLKVVEIVFYGSATFEPYPKRTALADDNLRHSVALLVKDADSLNYEEDEFDRLLMYTRARTLYAVCHDDRSLMNTFTLSSHDLMAKFAGHRLLLFRMLHTLLMIESRLVEMRISAQVIRQFPTANTLFSILLDMFRNKHQTLIEMIVSPETDGLTYIAHYAHRILLSNDVEFEFAYLLRFTEEWRLEYAAEASRLLNGVIKRLNEMHPISESAEKAAQSLIVLISRAYYILQ
ncbi:hypothetical protein Aperf_G00000094430 [Anoplocephala perfoliata]